MFDAIRKIRQHRLIVFSLIAGLLLPAGLFVGGMPEAKADGSAAGKNSTLSINSSAPTMSPGATFIYNIGWSCLLAGGCGAATLKLQLPEHVTLDNGFSAPPGATATLDDDGVTLKWASFSGTTTWPFAVQVAADTPYGLNGQTVNASANLQTAAGADLTVDASATLNLTPVIGVVIPAGTAGTNWHCDDSNPDDVCHGATVINATAADTIYDVTAKSTSNTAAALSFDTPGAASVNDGNLGVFEIFDLTSLNFSANPNGATVTFRRAGGGTTTVNVPAGELAVTGIPSDVTGYQVVFDDVAQDDSITVSAGLRLRDTRRSNAAPVIEPGSDKAMAVATTDVTATAGSQTASAQTSATMSVNLAAVLLGGGKQWNTASGDKVSVFGSQEKSTTQIIAVNSSPSTLSYLQIEEPDNSDASKKVFNYTAMTGAPFIQFPRGATAAEVTYYYNHGATVKGETRTMTASGYGPGLDDPAATSPAVDELDWSKVTKMVVRFTGAITPCPPESTGAHDLTCAGLLKFSSTLRQTTLLNDAPVTPADGANIALINTAVLTAQAGDSATGSQSFQDTLTLVPPQYQVNGTKIIGGQSVNYPPTGSTMPGDWYFTNQANQSFGTHPLTFSGGSTRRTVTPADWDTAFGPASLTFSDPAYIVGAPDNMTAYLAAIKRNDKSLFWNDVQMTTVPSPVPRCFANNGGAASQPVPAAIAAGDAWAYVVDQLPQPTKVEKVPLDSVTDPALIVGLVYTVKPVADRFPVNTECTIDSGSVKWRDNRVSDGAAVTTSLDNEPGTPGLLARVNTVDVRSEMAAEITKGANADYYKATPNAPFYLVDRTLSDGFKSYPADAPGTPINQNGGTPPLQMGIERQKQPTSFSVFGSVGDQINCSSLWVVDGSLRRNSWDASNSGLPDSFNVFALTALRYARLGPDQILNVTMTSKDGDVPYTARAITGQAAPGTDPEDSQSPGYAAYYQTKRAFQWFNSAGNPVPVPSAAELADIIEVSFDVRRISNHQMLPKYAAAGIVVDVTLRDNELLAPHAAVTGKSAEEGGQPYMNVARIFTASVDRSTQPAADSRRQEAKVYAVFTVFKPSGPYGAARIDWSGGANDNLIAGTASPSTVTMAVYNNTAVGGDCARDGQGQLPPADQHWACPNRLGVGVSTMTVSTGKPGNQPNLFAIADFQALTGITWPATMNGGRATAVITYTYANGNEVKVTAPPDNLAAAQPPANDPVHPVQDIVGVAVTFDAGDSVILTHDVPARGTTGYEMATAQAKVVFTTTLRGAVRPGYSYDFSTGDPAHLAGGTPISGPVDNGDPQVATAWAAMSATAHFGGGTHIVNQPTQPDQDGYHDSVTLLRQAGGIMVSTAWKQPDSQPLYRDQLPPTAFTITAGNDSNLPVDQLRVAADACLIDPATWPSSGNSLGATPPGCQLTPGSVFDAFDLTGLKVTKFPASTAGPGAAGNDTLDLTVWYLTAQGWFSATTAGLANSPDSGQTNFPALALPQAMLDAGLGWGDVIGFRLAVDGRGTAKIVNNVTGSPDNNAATRGNVDIELDVKLRQTLRSDPATRAPGGDNLPAVGYWSSANSAQAATYQKNAAGDMVLISQAADAVKAAARIYTGRPDPSATMQVAHDGLDDLKPSGQYVAPGNWADFYVGLDNAANATGDLYGAVIVNRIPEGLVYNAAGGHRWAFVSGPAGMTAADIDCDLSPDKTALTCAVASHIKLAPGEKIVVKVPLQLQDGTKSGQPVTNQATIKGHGIYEDPANPSACVTSEQAGANPQCQAAATITAIESTAVRAETYLAGGTPVIPGGEGDGCASALAAWSSPAEGFYRDPCRARTVPGGKLTYRMMIVNAGNNSVDELRFVNALPTTGDQGSIATLENGRGSQFTPRFVPGSLKLVTEAGGAPGFRGDGVASAAFHHSERPAPCDAATDSAGDGVLGCGSGWTPGNGTDGTRSIKGHIVFDKPLQGGEYILVEFQMIVPPNTQSGQLIVDDAAVSGRSSGLGWLNATSATIVTAEVVIPPVEPPEPPEPPVTPETPEPPAAVPPPEVATGGSVVGRPGSVLGGGALLLVILLAMRGAMLRHRRWQTSG